MLINLRTSGCSGWQMRRQIALYCVESHTQLLHYSFSASCGSRNICFTEKKTISWEMSHSWQILGHLDSAQDLAEAELWGPAPLSAASPSPYPTEHIPLRFAAQLCAVGAPFFPF